MHVFIPGLSGYQLFLLEMAIWGAFLQLYLLMRAYSLEAMML